MRNYLVIFLLVLSFNSFACDCIIKSKTSTAYKDSKYVVSGTVINVELIKVNNYDSYQYIKKVKVAVKEVFKGKIKIYYTFIYTHNQSGACGVNFKLLDEYIIYGNENYLIKNETPDKLKNKIWTNSCTNTKHFNSSEIKELRKLKFQSISTLTY